MIISKNQNFQKIRFEKLAFSWLAFFHLSQRRISILAKVNKSSANFITDFFTLRTLEIGHISKMGQNEAYLADSEAHRKTMEKKLEKNDLGFDYLYLRLPQMRFGIYFNKNTLYSLLTNLIIRFQKDQNIIL